MNGVSYYRIITSGAERLKYEARYSLVMAAKRDGVKPAAREHGVSKNTVRKWLRRYQERGVAGLAEVSRAPHHIPHKTKPEVEAQVLSLKRRLKKFGSKRLKRDHDLPCSHGAIARICREHGLNVRRKRKRQRRNDLREEKSRYRAFEQTCNDTKHLTDIPEYWTQAKQHNLPWFQYSHRDIRTGAMFLGYADELSLAHATLFAEFLVDWYRSWGIELTGTTWRFDGGSEYIGSWQAKEPSSYQKTLAQAGIQGMQIPKTTYNAEVETIHHTVEFEFFEVENFSHRAEFMQKGTTYQRWYNCTRRNCYRQDQSPLQILQTIAPEINPKVLTLPALDLDFLMQEKISFLGLTGGHHVPRHAQNLKDSGALVSAINYLIDIGRSLESS